MTVARGSTAGGARQRRSYTSAYLLGCLIAIALGAFLLTMTASWGLFALFCAPAVLTAAALTVREVYYFRVNVYLLTFATTLIGYFGPLVGAALPGSPLLMPNDPAATAVSVGLIAVSLAPVLLLYALFPRPTLVVDWRSIFRQRRFAMAFVLTGSALQAALIASGRWTYGSLSSNMQESGAGLLMFVSVIAIIIAPLSAALLAFQIKPGKPITPVSLVLFGCVTVSLIWTLIAGRRIFATAVIMQSAAFFSVYWSGSSLKKKISQGAIAAILGFFIISIGWQTFYMFRVASYSLHKGAAVPNITEMYQLSKRVDERTANTEYAKNLSGRTLIISTVNAVSTNARGFLGGEGLLNASLVSVPAVIFPDKIYWEQTGGGSQELLWARRLGVPVNDWANSLFIDSYADFWIFGLSIYLLILNAIMIGFRQIFGRDGVLGAIATIVFLTLLLNVETGMVTLLSTTRNIILLLPVGLIATFMAGSGSRRAVSVKPAPPQPPPFRATP